MQVTCQDGVKRAFHSNRTSAHKGFVYVGKVRVYGRTSPLYVDGALTHTFTALASSQWGYLVRPSASPSEQLDAAPAHTEHAYA